MNVIRKSSPPTSIKHDRARTRTFVVLASSLAIAVALLSPSFTQAEEGGSGHYFPGTISSLLDGVSPKEVFILRLNGIHYSGDIDASRSISIAGQVAVDVNVKSSVVGLTAFWRPSWGDLGEKWSFAMSGTLPIVTIEIDAEVDTALGVVRARDTETGIGDLVLMPLMFNYHVNDDMNINTRLGIYAPTGSYKVGRLANLGKNFWTFEPMVGFMYMGTKNGREASIFFGADLNTKNGDTNYQTGTQLHIDGTLAQHIPVGKGLLGLGVTGFWYQQVEGDSGSGATLGDLKARTNGIGPSVTFNHAVGKHTFVGELKWVHELGVRRRTAGNSFILKAMLTF